MEIMAGGTEVMTLLSQARVINIITAKKLTRIAWCLFIFLWERFACVTIIITVQTMNVAYALRFAVIEACLGLGLIGEIGAIIKIAGAGTGCSAGDSGSDIWTWSARNGECESRCGCGCWGIG